MCSRTRAPASVALGSAGSAGAAGGSGSSLPAPAVERGKLDPELPAPRLRVAPGDDAFDDHLLALVLEPAHEIIPLLRQVRGAHVHAAAADVHRLGLERWHARVVAAHLDQGGDRDPACRGSASFVNLRHGCLRRSGCRYTSRRAPD